MPLISSAPEFLDLDTYLAKKGLTFEAIEEPLAKARVDLLTGSLVRGHGTEESDIDGYRFVSEDGATHEVANIVHNGVRIDIENIPVAEIEHGLARLAEFDPLDPSQNALGIKLGKTWALRPLVDVMGRIAEGRILPASQHADLPARIRASHLRHVATAIRWMDAENRYEDALGFLKMGAFLSCHMSTIDCLCHALLALLNRDGIFCDRTKWAIPFAHRLPEELVPDLERMILPKTLDRAHLRWALRQNDRMLNAAKETAAA